MCVGEPISFSSERNGNLLTDLSPVKGKENALTNEGSEAELGWHTEHAASAYLLDPPQRVVDCLTFSTCEVTRAERLRHLLPTFATRSD